MPPEDPIFSLEAGIDSGRFSDRVRQAARGMRQGSLVAVPPLIYGAHAGNPLYDASVAWARSDRASSGVVNVRNETRRPPWGMVVTQTCDLVEEGAKPKRPWVLIAPVYRLRCDRGTRRRIERERGFNYLCPVTGLRSADGALWVADLRLLIAVEKGWLVGSTTRAGFADEAGYERVARQLSRLFARPAYATTVVKKVLEPLNRLLGAVLDEYRGRDPIIEVGLALGRSRLDPTTVQVFFLLDGPLDADLREDILSWGQSVVEDPPEGVTPLLPRIVQLDDLSAREYRMLDQLDVAAFSPAEEEVVVLAGSEPSQAQGERSP